MEAVLNIYIVAQFAGFAVVLYRLCRTHRPSEEQRAAAAAARVGIAGPDEGQFVADLEAQMKAYAAEVADFYDTTTGDR